MAEGGPEAIAGLLVGGPRAQGILGLLAAHWWSELGPGVSDCKALNVLGLVPVHWYVQPGPGPSGRQGYVQE